MYKKIIEDNRLEINKSIGHFKEELMKLRTGRANPGLIEGLMVDYYGSKTPLKQTANITVPEPRSILVQPWDIDSLTNIEAAIKDSDLNLSLSNDGKVIRISIPPLNEERRLDLVKVLNSKAEDARISVRNVREGAWQEIQQLEKSGAIAEDDKFRAKDELQDVINECNKKIDEIRKKKEEEIMTV